MPGLGSKSGLPKPPTGRISPNVRYHKGDDADPGIAGSIAPGAMRLRRHNTANDLDGVVDGMLRKRNGKS